MPYRKAHYFIFAILVATLIGFWPSYFQQITNAPLAFHVHGVIALSWIFLMIFQSWSIHSKYRKWHRKTGLVSLALLPLLTGSLVMIANVSAAGYLTSDPYYQQLGPVFGFATVPPFIAYLILYSQALRHRRNVQLHAGYMLGTAFFMWEPAAARLLVRFVPGFDIAGPEEFYKAADAIAFGIVLPLLLAVYLYYRHRKFGTPMLLVSAFLVVQLAGIYLIAATTWWRELFAAYATLSAFVTVGLGVALGVLASWYGWTHPKLKRS